MKRLSDEDVERIADAVARKIVRQSAPLVAPTPWLPWQIPYTLGPYVTCTTTSRRTTDMDVEHEEWCHYGNGCCGCKCGIDDSGPNGDPSVAEYLRQMEDE